MLLTKIVEWFEGFFKLIIMATVKMIVKQLGLVHKLVLHVATNNRSLEGTLLAGYISSFWWNWFGNTCPVLQGCKQEKSAW